MDSKNKTLRHHKQLVLFIPTLKKGFIRAEIVGYDDFIEFNGESGAKEAGKWRLEGKEYRVKDGDVIHFRF